MNVLLPSPLRAELVELAIGAVPREACGTLIGRMFGDGVEVVRVTHGANLAPPGVLDRFELDPLHVARADDEARRDGLALVGFWHSHPSSPPVPSAHDRTFAAATDLCVIVSPDDRAVRCWSIAGDRFVGAASIE